ncbi:FeoA family protein [Marichromatium purpuratum]|nr:FeoA family protein [Marichromatium purpuratum]
MHTAPTSLPAQQQSPHPSYPLTMADDNTLVRVCTLLGGRQLVRRLTELGLNQGAELRVVQRQGGGLIVARGETRIALGGGMAAKILVTDAAIA